MFDSLLKSVFGSHNERILKKMRSQVLQINQLEDEIARLSDEELAGQFAKLRAEHMQGANLDSLLPRAFATVREGGKRHLNMRHFDVQLLGGLILHEGRIAEMRTGEGKTLVATLPTYLHALTGMGVHIVTVNDYLAKRDAEWMGRLYRPLGLSVGVVHSGQTHEEKKDAYAADITYGTNNEFGFDYLRDNLATRPEQRAQRNTYYAIVDEVDSILIDEARTPLIISGPRSESREVYQKINRLIPEMKPAKRNEANEVLEEGDFFTDEKNNTIELTDAGHDKMERLLTEADLLKAGESLYGSSALYLLHHVQAALKAHHLYKRDVAYLVQNGQVVIVDEHTGRALPGRRWSEGIHQAVEAKEGLEIQRENRTLASITFQNYFRLYDILAGMTGTADTEAYEFRQIYDLEVVVAPTHKPMVRADRNDLIFMTEPEKYDAMVADIGECIAKQQPVLVGTASVNASERLSDYLRRKQIPHEVLNAKNHEREADIIAGAGMPGRITIATNMAGRGTDIVLGGNIERELSLLEQELSQLPEAAAEGKRQSVKEDWQKRHDQVIRLGGLHIIGSERHESRRIDNQLRGRSGRQGDPGSSRFYLSMEDDLMRIFASERVVNMMRSLGLPKGEPIEHRMVTKAVERAQRKVEGRNFDIRKQLLEYDDVANSQRLVIYKQREELLGITDMNEVIKDNITEAVHDQTLMFVPEQPEITDDETRERLREHLHQNFRFDLAQHPELSDKSAEQLAKILPPKVYDVYREKYEQMEPSMLNDLERQVMLQVTDSLWREHLQTMEYIRQGIHLRGYAQRNPKEEYKKEAYIGFERLLERIRTDTLRILFNIRMEKSEKGDPVFVAQQPSGPSAGAGEPQQKITERHDTVSGFAEEKKNRPQPPRRTGTYVRNAPKVGRNAPCPCGSGKKYKNCHGKGE